MEDTRFVDKLRDIVNKHDDEQLAKLPELIDIINSRMEVAANNGYEKFVIMFTRNDNIKDLDEFNKSSIQTYTIRANNDYLVKAISSRIKEYYENEDRGCNVIYRNPSSYSDKDLIIEWV